MLRSMTGYGRGEHEGGGSRFTVEVKSVNHRYCDIALRIPREISFLEEKAKKVIQKHVSRGRVDAVISMEEAAGVQGAIRVDKALAEGYIKALRELASLGVKDDISTSTLARFPDIFIQDGEPPSDELWPVLERGLLNSLDSLVSSREQEGRGLALDLEKRLSAIEMYALEIEERAPGVVEDYRNRLREQAEKLLPGQDAPEDRLLMEVVLFAEKSSITEELVRLKSHVSAFSEALGQGGAVGRKLDFIVQEINREINTISAKANDYDISRRVVEIKSQVEKIREQVQNIE